MEFSSAYLLGRLAALAVEGAEPSRYLVAFSGGVDSTVLLHALAKTREEHRLPVLAVHVDHGFHAASADWDRHCRRVAAALDIPYEVSRVEVEADTAAGVEAAAREARYAALQGSMRRDDWLLSAHHEGDQAETLLLNLMRGSGLAGLAGIGLFRSFGPGFLVRPLLGVPGEALSAYATEHGLDWIEDPSNLDLRFDRNFLRNEVMPLLRTRWPAVSARLAQSAALAGEASELLAELAAIDLDRLGGPGRLDIDALRTLSGPRQRNAIRHAIRESGLPPAPATRLYQVVAELVPARGDAQPLVRWPGAEIRRHRGHLYVLSTQADVTDDETLRIDPSHGAVDLGPGQGRLSLEGGVSGGIRDYVAKAGLTVRYRQGGEEIRPAGDACTRKLKKLLQDRQVVPWMRQRIPLLYAGEDLVAVADLWVASEFSADEGYRVCWQGGPPLY